MGNCSTSCCLPFIGYTNPCQVRFKLLQSGLPYLTPYFAILKDDKGNLIKSVIEDDFLVFRNLNENSLNTVTFYSSVDNSIIQVCISCSKMDAFQFRTNINLSGVDESDVAFEVNCPLI